MAKIISFKGTSGGSGTSTITSNVSSYLANILNKKVLVIDFNLECPSLNYFFKNQKTEKSFLNILEGYKCMMRSAKNNSVSNEEVIAFYEKSLKESTIKINENLSLIGNHSNDKFKDSRDELNSFDWFIFEKDLDGYTSFWCLLDVLKASEYDYVFFDCGSGNKNYTHLLGMVSDVFFMVNRMTLRDFEILENNYKLLLDFKEDYKLREKVEYDKIFIPILSNSTLQQDTELMDNFKNLFNKYMSLTLKNKNVQLNLEKMSFNYNNSLSGVEKNIYLNPQKELLGELMIFENKIKNISNFLENLNL